jgi:spermidine synthase
MNAFNYDIDISEQAGVRSLHFSSDWVQGAMRISRPWALELDYTRDMMAALALRHAADWPRRVLLIGLGAASLTKFLYRHRPRAKLTVVEINPAVVSAARQFFKLPDDPQRIRIEVGDGAAHVAKNGAAYDLILVDGYDEDGKTGMLDTLPFYLNCQARLGDDGLLAVNLLSRRKDFAASVGRLTEAFAGRALAFPPCVSGNAVAFAAAGAPVDVTHGELKAAIFALKKETGLNLLPTLVRLEQARTGAEGRLVL